MRYFRLLVGAHQEPGKKNYQAVVEYDKKTGKIIREEYPIVPSEKDLVKLFGEEKFQEVPRDQVPQTLLRAAEDKESEKTSPKDESSDSAAYQPDKTDKEEIQKATEEGAKDIGPNLGKDVTERFPVAANANLKVYMKPGGKYIIVDPDDGNKVITAGGPVSKDKVDSFVEDYLET
jgi:hypothetical protein